MIKKGVRLFSFVIVLVLLFSFISFISVYAEESSDSNTVLGNQIWDSIKGTTKENWDKFYGFTSGKLGEFGGYVGDKVERLIGVKNLQGESINIFSGNFWKSQLWYYYFTFSLFLILFGIIFNIIFFISLIDKNDFINNFYDTLEWTNWNPLIYIKRIWIPALVYPILMGIPLIIRFLQIITLEILGIHWLWRSFIWAAILFFSPIMWEKYLDYRKRTRIYEEKLKKIAGEEAVKAMMKR